LAVHDVAEIRDQQPDQGQATRARIIQAARELVVERGYEAVSMADVLARAGVSRGGLYHHFAGKQELLAAVLEAVERDLITRLAEAVADAPSALSALRTGSQWFLDECAGSVELQRAGLLEGRKALGWTKWRETVGPFGLTMLSATLAEAMEAGEIERTDPTALAHLILAALHEASAIIASAPDPQAERVRTGGAVEKLVDGLRAR
jgi:AcrR family transcriptional regulator